MKITSKLWIGMAVLAVLSPLGLILPEYFKAGTAWGEWSADEIQALVGYIPNGLAKLAARWTAPIPDYAFKGWEERGLSHLSFAYIISAFLGMAVVSLLAWLIGRTLTKKEVDNKE